MDNQLKKRLSINISLQEETEEDGILARRIIKLRQNKGITFLEAKIIISVCMIASEMY